MSENNSYQSNLPDMPMKAHKFLIYFWLWLLAIIAVVSACQNISALGQLQQYDTSAIKGMPLVYLQTVLLFIEAIYLIKIRFDLAKFKAGAPKALSIGLVILMCVNLINVVFFIMNNIQVETSVLTAPVANIATMLYYRRYYNARDQYFVN